MPVISSEYEPEYEPMYPPEEPPEYRYTVVYKGPYFEGDPEDPNHYNRANYNRWEDAIGLYNFLQQYDADVSVDDNEYGVRLRNDEWY